MNLAPILLLLRPICSCSLKTLQRRWTAQNSKFVGSGFHVLARSCLCVMICRATVAALEGV